MGRIHLHINIKPHKDMKNRILASLASAFSFIALSLPGIFGASDITFSALGIGGFGLAFGYIFSMYAQHYY
jgi:hypothetical protein